MINKSKDNTGPSIRQLRVNEIIRRAVIEVLSSTYIVEEKIGNISLTVSQVVVASDLRSALVYVYPFNSQNISQKQLLIKLDEIAPGIRIRANKLMKLKFSPKLIFRIDESFDYADKIYQIIDKISLNG